MGMLSLNRLMFKQQRRRRRRIQARNGLIPSAPKENDSLCQENGCSEGGNGSGYSVPNFSEDIWWHIHSRMPLQDSARSACVSSTFLHCWRCHPKLTFTKEALGLKQTEDQNIGVHFPNRVDHIVKNHSGVGVKILKLVVPYNCSVSTCHLTSWLQKAITPGIEEVTLTLPRKYMEEYSFPCSVLSNGSGNSIWHLHLSCCAFHPTVGFDCLRNLKKLVLYKVCITEDELGRLISNSFALEHLKLAMCNELICLRIPFWLERLSYLYVAFCKNLKVIESTAPNLSTFSLIGDPVQMSLEKSSQVKNLNLGFSYELNIADYAIADLPSIVPHLETLALTFMNERIDAPMAADKFLHLKHLNIFICIDHDCIFSYNYMSLVSFLDASPLLETFNLSVMHREGMRYDSVSEDASHVRQIPEHKHDRLKKVHINGFCSAKSMVELTCHILEIATSLKSLSVDTVYNVKGDGNISRCSLEKNGECRPISRDWILEAHKALGVIRSCILDRVPPTVKFHVGEPCNRCHTIDVKLSNTEQ